MLADLPPRVVRQKLFPTLPIEGLGKAALDTPLSTVACSDVPFPGV
jgi:hypothetical protein